MSNSVFFCFFKSANQSQTATNKEQSYYFWEEKTHQSDFSSIPPLQHFYFHWCHPHFQVTQKNWQSCQSPSLSWGWLLPCLDKYQAREIRIRNEKLVPSHPQFLQYIKRHLVFGATANFSWPNCCYTLKSASRFRVVWRLQWIFFFFLRRNISLFLKHTSIFLFDARTIWNPAPFANNLLAQAVAGWGRLIHFD